MRTERVWRQRRTAAGLALGALLVFALLATLNSGGYQYGASDQAFYIPAIRHHLDPQLFPRDWSMLATQDRLNLFTAAVALVTNVTGISLPVLFFLAYVTGLAVFFGALVALGRTLYRSWWAVAALAFAMTLRHRVVESGVNTLESYMHPRMIAFAIGASAVAVFLRGRSWPAVVLTIVATVVHPTTGAWFCIWVGVAMLVSDRERRVALVTAAAAVGAAILGWLAWKGVPAGLSTRMDPLWLSVVGLKVYLFPAEWHAWAWAAMMAYPLVIGLLYRSRANAGLAGPRERGLVAGCFALFLALLSSLPLIAARYAFVIQLQIPRVLWMMELLVTAYVVWWLVERPARGRVGAGIPRSRAAVICAIALFAVTRGVYVTGVEHAGRPAVRLDLAATEWRDAMDWLATTPVTAHVLADPGHAWKYGTSVRVAAARDVLQEEAKDTAFALYSRENAMRVLTRIDEIGDFQQMTVARARALAAKYDLDYLIAEQPFDLPVAFRNRRFTIYELKQH